jgi:hypothetical protein
VLTEQAGGAAGDQASGPGVDEGRPLVRRLRVRPRQPGTRAASGPALGVLPPLCEELANGPSDIGTRKRGPKLRQKPKGFCRELQQSVERRAGGRIPLVISERSRRSALP